MRLALAHRACPPWRRAQSSTAPKPHVVLIVTDDVSHGDIGNFWSAQREDVG